MVSDLSNSHADMIHDAIEQMLQSCSDAMTFRLTAFDNTLSQSLREEQMMSEMIDAVNKSAEIEEKLIALMSMKQFIDAQWGEIESEALANPHKKYVDKKGKISGVIKSHGELWRAKQRLDSCCTIAGSVIERLTNMQWVARAAAGGRISF